MSKSRQGAHSKEATDVTSPPAKKKSKKRNGFSTFLLVVGIALLAVALYFLGSKLWEYFKADKSYSDLSQLVVEDDNNLDVDWASLRAINPQIVAWVKIPDTRIDYPVVQGTDNEFYLHYSFDLQRSASGCPFLDKDNSPDLLDNNSFIYGHNMRNGSMFHDLSKFTDEDFFSSHPYAYIATPDNGTKRYRIVGALVVHGDEKVCQLQFGSLADYQAYISTLLDRCEVKLPDVKASDLTRTVVLSTCSYQFDDARTLAICAEVDDTGAYVQYPLRDASSTVHLTNTNPAT
jgi:sortase B